MQAIRGAWIGGVFFTFLALFPAVLLAKTTPAGFPSQSIWVSHTQAKAGDTLQIFTVIYNGGDTELLGSLVFLVDEKRVGIKSFELNEGESKILSTDWIATAGEHRIGALIENVSFKGSNDAATLSNMTTAAITITVAEPPPPPPLVAAAASTSEAISNVAKAATPVIENVLKTVYTNAEDFRKNTISKLETFLSGNTDGPVLGVTSSASTSLASVSSSVGSSASKKDPSFFRKAQQAAASAALATLKAKPLYYLLLLVGIIGGLYLAFRWAFKRPKFD